MVYSDISEANYVEPVHLKKITKMQQVTEQKAPNWSQRLDTI